MKKKLKIFRPNVCSCGIAAYIYDIITEQQGEVIHKPTNQNQQEEMRNTSVVAVAIFPNQDIKNVYSEFKNKFGIMREFGFYSVEKEGQKLVYYGDRWIGGFFDFLEIVKKLGGHTDWGHAYAGESESDYARHLAAMLHAQTSHISR